jgi:transcriptional regulator NrdR family protein
MHCPKCGSNQFRVSRLRPSDALQLLLFRYPIRCRVCNKRRFAGLSTVLKVQQADTARHAEQRRKSRAPHVDGVSHPHVDKSSGTIG